MKKSLFILCCLFSLVCSAQLVVPSGNLYHKYTQMWNASSVYFNTVTLPSQLGFQFDTIVNTASVTLESSTFFYAPPSQPTVYTVGGKNYTTFVNDDTVIASKTPGWGQLTVTASVVRATYTGTITPTYTQTVVSSSDGVNWAPVPGAAVYTITPTSSLTIPIISKWIFTQNPDEYIGVKTTGLQTNCSAAIQAWYDWMAPYVFHN
jgi:hypothetical protein